jgi:hypothetical protein
MSKLSKAKLRSTIRRVLLAERDWKKWTDYNTKKGQVITLSPADFAADAPDGTRDLDDEIFDLVQTAYADVELEPGKFGNAKVRSPADLPAGYSQMYAADLDGDPDPDYFRGGKMRNGRYKLGIVGHDGSKAAIQKYLDSTAEMLKGGAIAEMSGAIAHIMITRHNVPAVTTHEEVEKMLGKPVTWIGRHPEEKYAKRYGSKYEGWYSRNIGGQSHKKILLGGGGSSMSESVKISRSKLREIIKEAGAYMPRTMDDVSTPPATLKRTASNLHRQIKFYLDSFDDFNDPRADDIAELLFSLNERLMAVKEERD